MICLNTTHIILFFAGLSSGLLVPLGIAFMFLSLIKGTVDELDTEISENTKTST